MSPEGKVDPCHPLTGCVSYERRQFSDEAIPEIEDFTFHDLRHCFTTNMRRAGGHDLIIMAITGHKTMSMFHRYSSVGSDELKAAVDKIGHL